MIELQRKIVLINVPPHTTNYNKYQITVYTQHYKMSAFIKQIPSQVSSFIPGFKYIHPSTSTGERTTSPERNIKSPLGSRTTSPNRSSSSSPISTSPPKNEAPPKPWIEKVYDSIEQNNLKAFNKHLNESPYDDYCINSEFYQSIIELTRFLIQRTLITFLDRLSNKFTGILSPELFLKNIVFTGNRNVVQWYLSKPGIRHVVSDSVLAELASKQKWPDTEILGLIRLCFDQKNIKEYQEIAQILLDILFENELLAIDGYTDATAYTKLIKLAINYPAPGKGGSNIKPYEVVNTEMIIWLTNYYNTRYPVIPADIDTNPNGTTPEKNN